MKNIKFTSVVIGFLLCLVLCVSVAAVGGKAKTAGIYQMVYVPKSTDVDGDKIIIINTQTGNLCEMLL